MSTAFMSEKSEAAFIDRAMARTERAWAALGFTIPESDLPQVPLDGSDMHPALYDYAANVVRDLWSEHRLTVAQAHDAITVERAILLGGLEFGWWPYEGAAKIAGRYDATRSSCRV